MSIEAFVAGVRKQLAEAEALRSKAVAPSEKTALTRKINELKNYIHKATRVGLQE